MQFVLGENWKKKSSFACYSWNQELNCYPFFVIFAILESFSIKMDSLEVGKNCKFRLN